MEGVDESAPYSEHFEAHYPETKSRAERLVLAASGEGLHTAAACMDALMPREAGCRERP